MKSKNSYPSSEFEHKDKCPSCGSYCDIFTDLNEKDECFDCRKSCRICADTEEITEDYDSRLNLKKLLIFKLKTDA